eukprot:jgi/Mesvir1/21265/Mv21666-RA.1
MARVHEEFWKKWVEKEEQRLRAGPSSSPPVPRPSDATTTVLPEGVTYNTIGLSTIPSRPSTKSGPTQRSDRPPPAESYLKGLSGIPGLVPSYTQAKSRARSNRPSQAPTPSNRTTSASINGTGFSTPAQGRAPQLVGGSLRPSLLNTPSYPQTPNFSDVESIADTEVRQRMDTLEEELMRERAKRLEVEKHLRMLQENLNKKS